ncbi:TipAS antibiotic-recognition domain-containing protein [Paenibacillus barcinonensis]|uniref:MerR family transcriptional regulator n=1 Tax=Paenibacillus barcinonensis TaxID=198119 RepID=UPI001C100658|nr:TipAS antibiotic-recognition domain-containing protein [Paenibacillus barcinonensis]MBU5355894.1 TipAS antibiotic-recognition domain-containing protein [Paenibacillus barcinonensis]
MAYSMTDVSGMSGVSLNELSHYAELGLLSPAFRGLDEDMYYEKRELLKLQQIMFCKEAGVPEKEMGPMLKEHSVEIVSVMQQHRIQLLEEALRLHGLIQTLDKTVSYLQGEREIEAHELYNGFVQHTSYPLLPEAGGTEHSLEPVPDNDLPAEEMELKSKEDFLNSQAQIDQIHLDLKQAMELDLAPGSPEVQQIIGRHLEWIKGYYTPTPEIYRDLADLYVEHQDFRSMYDGYHPRLAEYLREGMIIKAAQDLS